MFEFVQRFFGRPSSSATAKERLRLVLLSDHLSLAPDVVEALKHDLIAVISRYCDVDADHCDVTFEQQDKQVAMLANIPILGMHNRPKPPAAPPPAAPRAPEPPPSLDTAGVTAAVAAEPASVVATASPDVALPAAETDAQPMLVEAQRQRKPGKAGNGQPKPARRRRRKSAIASTAPQAT